MAKRNYKIPNQSSR